MSESLKLSPPPRSSRINALKVMMPRPPSCMRISSVNCPPQLNSSTPTTVRPVTQTALVAVKRLSVHDNAPFVYAPGSFSRRVPKAMRRTKEKMKSRCPSLTYRCCIILRCKNRFAAFPAPLLQYTPETPCRQACSAAGAPPCPGGHSSRSWIISSLSSRGERFLRTAAGASDAIASPGVPGEFSRTLRMTEARSITGSGRPARRATWIP